MKTFKKWMPLICVLGFAGLTYLAVSDIAVDQVISKHPSGEIVASMGSGLLLVAEPFLDDSGSWQPPDFNKHRYTFNTIEYRNSKGQTLARYKPNWAPNDFAYVHWTDNHVAITSGQNGDCPDFRVFERQTGKELDPASAEVSDLPEKIKNGFDPCGWERLKKRRGISNEQSQ